MNGNPQQPDQNQSSPPETPQQPVVPPTPPSPAPGSLEEKMQKVIAEEAYLRGVEAQLKAIQTSTRTTFPIFAPVHDFLRRRFKTYYKYHLNPMFNQVNVGILLAYVFLIGFFVANQIGIIGPKARTRAAAGIAKVISYQGKLTDASDVPVSDGSYNVKFAIYDAESAGNCLYAARGSCGAPGAKSITVTKGIFSTLLGESGDNLLDLDFNSDTLFLSVTVGSDSEMAPRKRVGAVGYAFNADTVDGAHAGTTANNVLQLNSSGNIVIAGGATLDTNTFVVDAAGNKVGIGTASPTTFNLQVAGSIGPNADDSSDLGSSSLRWRDLFLGPTSLHLVSTAGETTTARDWKLSIQETVGATQGNLRVLEGVNELVNITSSGSVGVGVTNPGQKLSVAGTLGVIETGVSPTYYTIFQGGDQAADLTYTLPTAYPAANDYVLASSTSGALSWVAQGSATGWVDDGTVVRLTTSTDSVGIGTASPASKLHVVGGDIVSGLTTGGSNNIAIGTTNIQARIDLAASNLSLNASGGNVGIGMSAPVAILNLKGTLSSALTGTVAVTNLSAAVTGTGTAFTTELAVGDSIKISSEIFTVSAIASATSLTLDSAYQGATASGLTAYRDPTLFAIDNGDAVNKLTVTRSGNVGIGISNPSANLHISGAAYNTQAGIKLAGSSASTNLTTDFSALGIQNTNTTTNNYARFDFLDDQGNIAANIAAQYTNHTANAQSADLIFGTRNTGAWSEKMHITSAGNVGIGTTAPASLGGFTPVLNLKGLYPSVRLENTNASRSWEVATLSGGNFTIYDGTVSVNRFTIDTGGLVSVNNITPYTGYQFQTYTTAQSYAALFYQQGNAPDRYGLHIVAGTNTTGTLIRFGRYDGNDVGTITHNGTNTSYNTSSDERLKKDIQDTAMGLNNIMQIKVRDFKFKSDVNNKTFTGFIAQELAPIFSEAVFIPEDTSQYWQVDYGKLTPLLVKSIQDQQGEIDGLKAKDDNLQNQINLLQSNISSGITTNNLVVNNSAQFNSSLVVAGAAQFDGVLLVKQAATFEGELLAKEAVTFEKTLLVKDTATFEKDLIVKGNLVLADNNKGINLIIPASSLTHAVVFAAPQPDEKYAVNVSPAWNTNYWITNKTPAGFSINFGVKPIIDSTLDWIIVR